MAVRTFDRNIEDCDLRMQDGSLRRVKIYELSNEGMVEWLELADEWAKVIRQVHEEFGEFLAKMSDDSLSEEEKDRMLAEYNQKIADSDIIKRNELREDRLWQIMTGEQDVSWRKNLYPSVAKKVSEFFIMINPGFEIIKKKLEIDELTFKLQEALAMAEVMREPLSSLEGATE